MENESSNIIYPTVSIDKKTGRLIEKICKRYSLKKSEVVKLTFLYLEKAHINPADVPEYIKSELTKINKRQDDIIRFIRKYEASIADYSCLKPFIQKVISKLLHFK